MPNAVFFRYGKKWHFTYSGGTVCGKRIPPRSLIRNLPPSDAKFCSKCLQFVGDEMMTEYLGYNWLDEPTMSEITNKEETE